MIIISTFSLKYILSVNENVASWKSFTYPSCAQGSEPDERFYFHAPVSHCDKVNFKAEQRISHQNCSFKSQGHYLRGS